MRGESFVKPPNAKCTTMMAEEGLIDDNRNAACQPCGGGLASEMVDVITGAVLTEKVNLITRVDAFVLRGNRVASEFFFFSRRWHRIL